MPDKCEDCGATTTLLSHMFHQPGGRECLTRQNRHLRAQLATARQQSDGRLGVLHSDMCVALAAINRALGATQKYRANDHRREMEKDDG